MNLRSAVALFMLVAVAVASTPAQATVPAGFQDTLVASGISAPAVLAFAPDGRLFVGEKATGKIRIVKSGSLLATPLLTLSDFMPQGTYFDSYSERGLLGIAFDPAFATNQLFYVYYTICKVPGGNCLSAQNRIARFRANGDVVDASSHTVLLDDITNDAGNHNGGWLGIGPTDGKLYASVGDGGATSTKAQDLSNLNGKILRINTNGSIPSDNPFVGQAGKRGEIWAYGFRNPWRCRFRADGRLICADLGLNTWEEIDVVYRANNYGWPTTEGPFTLIAYPLLTPPIYSYNHNGGQAAITGGDFGTATIFPNDQQGYYFGDFTQGWINRALLDSSGSAILSVESFATNLGGNNVTDIVGGPDGSLYYTTYTGNAVRKIAAVSGNRSPIAVASVTPTQGNPPLTVQLSSAGSSDPDGNPITFSWSFGDSSPPSTAANPTHTYQSAGPYTATLTVSDGQASPGPGIATVAISVGNPPVITISQPTDGAIFQAGSTITLAGSATDLDQGALSSSALHWKITFHHAEHIHPYIDDLVGSPQSFTTAKSGEASASVAYEIALSATDATGLTATNSIVIVPQTADFTLATNPPGLLVTLDGQTMTTPMTVTGVVGFRRTLSAPSPQSIGAVSYNFTGWSDGGAQSHVITTQAEATTYTANFAAVATPTPARTSTPTPARTATPVPTATRTSTPTLTPTLTPAPTRTATPVPTSTPASVLSPTPAGPDLTAAGSIIARVTAPTGGGSRDLEVIRDGDTPPVGSTDSLRQYDTYDGANTAPDDWIGYAYPAPQTFQEVVFQEGKHFWDGGWFDTLTVQVRQNGAWTTVAGLTVTPPYAGNDGVNFETYTLDFLPITGDAIRLYGVPGGSADFISVGELRVYAAAIAPPRQQPRP